MACGVKFLSNVRQKNWCNFLRVLHAIFSMTRYLVLPHCYKQCGFDKRHRLPISSTKREKLFTWLVITPLKSRAHILRVTSSKKLLRELMFWIWKRNNSSLIGQCAGHVTRFLKSYDFNCWVVSSTEFEFSCPKGHYRGGGPQIVRILLSQGIVLLQKSY